MGMSVNVAFMYDLSSVDDEPRSSLAVLREADDAKLVTLGRQGDFGAFEELVKRYRNDVYALAYHYVRDREDAWDLSQEVFIKAHRGLGQFRGDASFKTWLLRITANRCKDHFKKRVLKTVAFDEALGADDSQPGTMLDPSEAMAAGELGEAIRTALASLPEKHRMAFVLREFEGHSYETMAKVMGCTMGTVMSRLHHARKKLQKALIAMGVVEDR